MSSRRWAARGIVLHFCNLFTHTRKLFTRACDLSVGVCESFIGARDRGIGGGICLRSGYGVHWRFPFPSNVIPRLRSTIRRVDQPPTLRSVLFKEWPYDGENGRMMEEYGITWR